MTRLSIPTATLLRQVRELIASGYDPRGYLDLWLVGDEFATPKPCKEGKPHDN
jgi:hypothetical protein